MLCLSISLFYYFITLNEKYIKLIYSHLKLHTWLSTDKLTTESNNLIFVRLTAFDDLTAVKQFFDVAPK